MDADMPDADDLNDISGQDDQVEPAELMADGEDPNNLYAGNVKEYEQPDFVILDATEPHPVFQREANESVHKKNCHTVEFLARDIFNANIKKICLPAHAMEAAFNQAIDNLLAGKTESNLMIFYFHGSGSGVNAEMKVRTEGGPHGGFHFWAFLRKLCNALPDSMVLWDGYYLLKSRSKPKLHTGNVEFIGLGRQILGPGGNVVHDDPCYVTESLDRNLRAWRKAIMGKEEDRIRRDHKTPQTIPQVWKWDYDIYNYTTRIKFRRPGSNEQEKLRMTFRMDPLKLSRTGRIQVEAHVLGPERPQIDILPADDDDPAGIADAADGAAAGAGPLPGAGNAANAGAAGVGAQPGFGNGLGAGAALGLANGVGAMLGAGAPAAAGNGAGAGVGAPGGGVNAFGPGAGALVGAAPAAQNAPAAGGAADGDGGDNNGLFVNQ